VPQHPGQDPVRHAGRDQGHLLEDLRHRFPAEHHKRIRHSSFIERTFGETRRRTKVIGRLPGETSCLTLVWAVLDRASAGWRGLAMTPEGLRLLQDLRRSLLEPPRQLRPRTVTAAQPAASPGTVGTVA
jgi:putative transposase